MHMVIPVSRQNYIRFLSFLEDSPGYTMNDMFEIMLDCYEKHQDSDYPLENQKEERDVSKLVKQMKELGL